MLATRFIRSLVLIFVHIESKCAVFLFKLSWEGPHCSDPNIMYRLRWSKTVTQLSLKNSVLMMMRIYYLTQRVAFTPQWWSYTLSPFFQGKTRQLHKVTVE